MLTFDLQDQIRGGVVADEALGGDAPQLDVVWFRAQTYTASCHCHTTTGAQAALLHQLETQAEEWIVLSLKILFLSNGTNLILQKYSVTSKSPALKRLFH